MKIVIAEDQGLMRQGLKALIEQQPDMDVVGVACDGTEVIEVVKQKTPDIVIMDISMPNLNGIEATRIILGEHPNIKIVALTMYPKKQFVNQMLEAGAMGYILKSYLFDELLNALHAVIEGQRYLSPKIADMIINNYVKGKGAPAGKSSLTQRERMILQMVAEGKNIKEIAMELNISPKTAHAHRRQLINKLNLSGVADLTRYAIKEGITSLDFQ